MLQNCVCDIFFWVICFIIAVSIIAVSTDIYMHKPIILETFKIQGNESSGCLAVLYLELHNPLRYTLIWKQIRIVTKGFVNV